MMDAYIDGNRLLVWAIVMVGGALVHWAVKVRRGEATPNFLAYWFTETPGYSVGTFGALVAAWWLVYTTDGLKGMAPHMLVEGAFTTGYLINSAVSPGVINAKPQA
jgi:hypothetical protein